VVQRELEKALANFPVGKGKICLNEKKYQFAPIYMSTGLSVLFTTQQSLNKHGSALAAPSAFAMQKLKRVLLWTFGLSKRFKPPKFFRKKSRKK